MNNKQKVHLIIETEIVSTSGHIEKTQMEADATWHIQDEEMIVSYQEGSDVEAIYSELCIPNHQKNVKLTRSGAVKLNHLFTVGKRTDSLYEIPQGYLDFGTKTKGIELQMKGNRPETLVLQYQFFLCQEEVGQFTVTHKFLDRILPNMHEAVH